MMPIWFVSRKIYVILQIQFQPIKVVQYGKFHSLTRPFALFDTWRYVEGARFDQEMQEKRNVCHGIDGPW